MWIAKYLLRHMLLLISNIILEMYEDAWLVCMCDVVDAGNCCAMLLRVVEE